MSASGQASGACLCDVAARSCECGPGDLPADIIDQMSAAKYAGRLDEVKRLEREGRTRIAAYLSSERKDTDMNSREEMINRLEVLGVPRHRETSNGQRIDQRSDAYLAARIEYAEGNGSVSSEVLHAHDTRTDGASSKAVAAHAAMVERNANAWRKPAATETRADEAPTNGASSAHAAMVDRNTNAWRKSSKKGA